MERKKMSSQKFIHNPVKGHVEIAPGHEKDKKTLGEKILEKGFRDKPLTNAELGTNQKKIHGQLKTLNKFGQNKLVKQALNTKGYKKQIQDPVTDKVTLDDWRNETPIYRKHLADSIADDQTNIRWDSAGGWRDKWGDPASPKDAVKEQQQIQKTYDGIFPPSMQKQYELSKKKHPKIIPTSMGNIKNLDNPYSDEAIERDVMRRERLGKPMSGNDAVIREIIRDKAVEKLKTMPPPQDNSEMINHMEEMARMKIQSDINSKKFESIMNKSEDPDLHKGVNSVDGIEQMKKEFNKLPKFQNRLKGYEGIGPHLTGEKDK